MQKTFFRRAGKKPADERVKNERCKNAGGKTERTEKAVQRKTRLKAEEKNGIPAGGLSRHGIQIKDRKGMAVKNEEKRRQSAKPVRKGVTKKAEEETVKATMKTAVTAVKTSIAAAKMLFSMMAAGDGLQC